MATLYKCRSQREKMADASSPSDHQLHDDRITALVVGTLMILVFALIVWLAMFASPEVQETRDLWQLLP